MSFAITGMLFVAIFVIVLRRVDTMTLGVTQVRVWLQFAILACSAFGSFYVLAMASEWAAVPMMAGVLVFLLLGGKRWKMRAPDGLSHGSEIDKMLAEVAASIRGEK
jgi:uncharacterized membrane protein YfhO